jgi:predicted ATPase
MSYPNATIYIIEYKYVKIDYQDTEHYQIVKSFINNTNGMTLLKEKDNGKEKIWK